LSIAGAGEIIECSPTPLFPYGESSSGVSSQKGEGGAEDLGQDRREDKAVAGILDGVREEFSVGVCVVAVEFVDAHGAAVQGEGYLGAFDPL